MRIHQLVSEISQQNGLTATLIRENNHYCFSLSNGDKKRLLVTGKTPSDRLFQRNVSAQIRRIARSIHDQNLH